MPSHPDFHVTSNTSDNVAPLGALAQIRQIDQSIDYAARAAKSTVSEFLAAPSILDAGGLPWIEVAVEFFIPPHSAADFAIQLDRALIRRSMEYSAARRSDQIQAIHLTLLPPGAFHQWRMAWNIDPRMQHDNRWTPSRRMLESVVHQAQTGWREMCIG